MKTALLALLFSFCTLYLFAIPHNIVNQLNSVNLEWGKHPEGLQMAEATAFERPESYTGWIKVHLMLVEKTLRQNTPQTITPKQKNNRLKLLDELNAYWRAGVFPINDYLPYKTPVFIDRKGTHCAVGYLMMQSGNDELAQAIDRNEKFAYLHQIKTNGVLEWANEFGFTTNELAWIQPCYGCVNGCTANTGEYKNVSCFGAQDGCIGFPDFSTISPPPTAPFQVDFYSGHDSVTGINPCYCCNPCDLGPGNYTYRALDATGTYYYFFYTITEPDSFSVTSIRNNACNGHDNGSINLNVTGASGPYIYSWSDISSSPSRTGLTTGSYSVTITDSNSCTTIQTFTIAKSDSIQLTIAITADSGSCEGAISTQAIGGSGNYTYLLNDTVPAGAIVTGLCHGNYSFTAVDSNGCSVRKTFTLPYAANTSVNNLTAGIYVYPNPVHDVLYVMSETGLPGELVITDITGRVVLHEKLSNSTTVISVKRIPSGIYFAGLAVNGQNFRKQILKQ